MSTEKSTIQAVLEEKTAETRGISGKLTLPEYEEFKNACQMLGLTKAKMATSLLRAALPELKAQAKAAADRGEAKKVRKVVGKKKGEGVTPAGTAPAAAPAAKSESPFG